MLPGSQESEQGLLVVLKRGHPVARPLPGLGHDLYHQVAAPGSNAPSTGAAPAGPFEQWFTTRAHRRDPRGSGTGVWTVHRRLDAWSKRAGLPLDCLAAGESDLVRSLARDAALAIQDSQCGRPVASGRRWPPAGERHQFAWLGTHVRRPAAREPPGLLAHAGAGNSLLRRRSTASASATMVRTTSPAGTRARMVPAPWPPG